MEDLQKRLKAKENLKPYNPVIQVCPVCRKVDVAKDDGHECNRELQQEREYANHYDI